MCPKQKVSYVPYHGHKWTTRSLEDAALGWCVLWITPPLHNASLARCVPCTMHMWGLRILYNSAYMMYSYEVN
jgi:hypothetical protein